MIVFSCHPAAVEPFAGAVSGFVSLASAGVHLDWADPLAPWSTPDAMRARGIWHAALDFENWTDTTDWRQVETVARKLGVLGRLPRWIVATPQEAVEQSPTKPRPRVIAELRAALKRPVGQLVGSIDRYGYPVKPAASDGSMTREEVVATIERARCAVLEAAEAAPERNVGLYVVPYWPVDPAFAHVAGLPMPQVYADGIAALCRELRARLGSRFDAVTIWYPWPKGEAKKARLSGGTHKVNFEAAESWESFKSCPVYSALSSLIEGASNGRI